MARNMSFYGEGLYAACPNPKLEGHPLSAARDCLVNIFAATLHEKIRLKQRTKYFM
jgi:hypothetical protein